MSAAPNIEPADTFTVSASSYEKFALRCERWWAFDKIEGKRDPDGEKAKLGTRCHAITEAYLRDGTAPNRAETFVISRWGSPKTFYPGRIVSNILHHLPPAGSVTRLEEKLDFRFKGIDFTGYIDWQDPKIIGDHKFTSSLQYAKSAEKLLTDPQGVIYRTARWLESDAKSATLQWTYGQFDCKASRKVVLPVVREFESIDRMMPTIERMARAKATITEANSLPATGLKLRQGEKQIACEMFGGCPNHPKQGGSCAVSGTQTHKGKIGAHFMSSSIMEKMRARKAAADAAANGGGTAVAAAVAEIKALADADEKVSDARAAAVASDIKAMADAQAAVAAADRIAALQAQLDAAKAGNKLPAGEINPPGEASQPLPKEETEAPVPAAQVGAALPAEAPKRGRGRPPKEAKAADTALYAAEAKAANDVNTFAGAPDTSVINSLFVDCRKVKGVMQDGVDASELIAKAHKLVCEDQSVKHYKFLDYGAGPGALSVALGMLLVELKSISVVYVSTGTPEARDVLQTLIEHSRNVFVGTR